MYLSPEAQRLLDGVRHSHEQLLAHFGAGERHRRAFRAIYESLEAAVADISDEALVRSGGGAWSAAQVLAHIAEHDQKIEEADRRGIAHMVEHGLEHARGLWLSFEPDGADQPPV